MLPTFFIKTFIIDNINRQKLYDILKLILSLIVYYFNKKSQNTCFFHTPPLKINLNFLKLILNYLKNIK